MAPKRFSNASMSDWGTAAPPAVMPRTVEKSIGVSRASRPFQMVGTPQASVGWCSLMTVGQMLPHEEHLRHDHVGAGHPGAVGGAPGVGVEHGHDDQDAVRLDHPDRGRRLLGHRVQPGGAVRVHDALRVAGGAARVAHGGGGALVELGPLEARLLGRQQPLVGQGLAEGRGVALARHDDRLDGLQLVLDGGQERDQRGVDDDEAVLGMVDDVGQLLGREPDVEGVQDGPHGRDGEIGLQVTLIVPAERADPVPRLDPEAGEGGRQLLRPGCHLGEGGRAVAARLDGDDGAVAVHLLPVTEDVADQERGVLHGAFHGPSMSSAPLPCSAARRGDRSVPWNPVGLAPR